MRCGSVLEKIVVVVKNGRVEEIYAPCPNKFDVEIIDLDTQDSDVESVLLDRLQAIRQYLCKIS